MLSFACATPAFANAVVVGRDKIVVRRAIPFASGRATLPASASALLDELARALKENPQFTKVRIEGHTDSSGNAERNRQLSQQRADAVLEALVARGVGKDRLLAKGFGATDPIESNGTASGRKRNRRVVFEVLQVGDKAVDRPPLAKVSERRNAVVARAPLEDAWRSAAVGDGLRRSWRIRTEEDSAAGITFRDASKIDMRAETLVIIFGASESSARAKPVRASLESGALTAWLNAKDDAVGRLLVETESGDANLVGGRASVRVTDVNGKPATAFSNHSGENARVYGKRKGRRMKGATIVKKGYGSRVKRGKKPEKPRPLPSPPTLEIQTPVAIATKTAGAIVRGSWDFGADKARMKSVIVQVRSLDDKAKAPTSVTAPADVGQFRFENLPAGRYEVSAQAIDNLGLESDLSPPSALVVAKIAPLATAESAPESFVAGDQIATPEGLECAVDTLAYGSPMALLVRPTSKQVRCRAKASAEDAGGATDAKETAVAIVVAAPPKMTVSGPNLAGGQEASVDLLRAQAWSDTDTVEVTGATLLREDGSADARGRRTVVVRPLRGVAQVQLTVRRRGIPVQTLSLNVTQDETPPTIASVDVKRAEDSPDEVVVTAKVTDDLTGVATVSVQASGSDDASRVSMSRAEQPNTYVATLPVGDDVERLTVSAIDGNRNGPVMREHPVPAAAFSLSPWWLALPMGLATPLVLVGGAALADGLLAPQTGGPFMANALASATGTPNDPATTAPLQSVAGGVMLGTGVITIAATSALLVGILATTNTPPPSE